MQDPMDFDATGSPDAAATYAAAFRVGQALASGAAPQTPTGPRDVSHLAGHIDATAPHQRSAAIAQAQQRNEQLAHVLIAIKTCPPEARLEIARHLAQTSGLLDPAHVSPADVTDQGLDAHLSEAMSVEQFLKQESLYAAIPHPLDPDGPADAGPTGAGHLTDIELATSLGL